jgi:hypothetical protein
MKEEHLRRSSDVNDSSNSDGRRGKFVPSDNNTKSERERLINECMVCNSVSVYVSVYVCVHKG